MVIRDVVLKNETGLHARPASMFVEEASRSKAEVVVIKDGKEFNGKSIMGILSMGARKGETLTIRAEGEGEEEVVENLVKLIENNFEK